MTEASQFYLDQRAADAGPAWLGGLRDEGADVFARLGFPTQKVESWKYTSLNSLQRSSFTLPGAEPAGPGGDQAHLVFVNGRLQAAAGSTQKGVRIASLAQLLEEDGDWLQNHLTSGDGELAMLAMNSAFMSDGFVIQLEPGCIVEKPIELIFHTHGDAGGLHYHPRNLIIAGAGSQATILERHLGKPGLANHGTQAVIGENALIRHYKLQDEDPAATHISTTLANVEQGGAYESFVMSAGAGLSRNEIRVRLMGQGCGTRLDGIYLGRGGQHMDHTTQIEHVSAGASSEETYKGVLDDKARAVFQGNIRVDRDAQKTDGRMSNATLLLSGEAEIDAKPQLEIYADDVKCSHGTTAGQIDDDALFYLRSRGIDEARARAMLVEAFLSELVEAIPNEDARGIFQARLTDWLAKGAKDEKET